MTVQELLEMSKDLDRFVIYDEATGKNIYDSELGNCKIKSHELIDCDKSFTRWYINSDLEKFKNCFNRTKESEVS